MRQRGSGAESRARALRADQRLCKQNHRTIVSQRGPESGSESQWEPEWESQRAIESQRETGGEPVI